MPDSLTQKPEVQELLSEPPASIRRRQRTVKEITQRISTDLCKTIEEFDVTPTEFWTAVSYVTRLGQANEVGSRSRARF
jgi:catechol 1,2-dioxygenase